MFLKVVIEDGWDGIQGMRNAWLSLLEMESPGTPFLDPDFCRLWLRFRSGTVRERPLVVALYEREELQALAPMCIAVRGRSILSLSRLRFMVSAPYLDSYFLPRSLRGSTLERLLTEAFAAPGCEMMDLFSMPRDSVQLGSIERVIRQLGLRFEASHSPEWMGSYGLVQKDWQTFLARRSSKTRYNLRRAIRGMESMGRHRVETFTSSSDPAPLMQDLGRIAGRSWKQSGDFAKGEFWAELVDLMRRKGWLDARVLYVRDSPAAFVILLRHRGVAYFMQTAYDRDFSQSSPGIYLISRVLEGIHGECGGTFRYDFLTNYHYLRSLSDASRSRIKLRGYPSGLRGTAVSLGFRAMAIRRRGQEISKFESLGDLLEAVPESVADTGGSLKAG